VKHAIIVTLLLVVMSPAQQPHAKTPLRFHWSWEESQELTWRQALATSKEITAEERAALVDGLAEQLRASIGTKSNLRALALKTRVKLVDLNGDGRPEVIAQPVGDEVCGATGNCFFWVFEKTASGYRLLLDAKDGDPKPGIQVFTIQPTRSQGFSDLVLGTHDSASERTLYLYRYHDGRYRQTDCYNADWWSTQGGSWHQLKQPEVTPCQR
jgi:hypothetical protein